jgi:hypothetical protein
LSVGRAAAPIERGLAALPRPHWHGQADQRLVPALPTPHARPRQPRVSINIGRSSALLACNLTPPFYPTHSSEYPWLDAPGKAHPLLFSPSHLPIPASPLWYRRYSVPVKGADGRVDLLQGVSGYLLPGTLTALMGSSGAGRHALLSHRPLLDSCTLSDPLDPCLPRGGTSANLTLFEYA